jgi:hypothetical protein
VRASRRARARAGHHFPDGDAIDREPDLYLGRPRPQVTHDRQWMSSMHSNVSVVAHRSSRETQRGSLTVL